jgi:hypothetical protein
MRVNQVAKPAVRRGRRRYATHRRRLILFGAALSVALTVLLGGCGSSSDDDPTLTAQPNSATSPSTFNGTLDDPTAAWFGAFCAASTSVAKQAIADYPAVTSGTAGTTAGTPQERQAAAKDAYGRLAATLASASTQLISTPAPNLGNLPTAASEYATAMKEAGTAFADAGTQIAAATITDNASFESAATQTFSSLQVKLGQLRDRAEAIQSAVDPTLETAVRARFSDCAGL